ncbi:MAG: hypothetical protein MZV64_19040 [Ignavibacteriales bacterium]|nr:hypothetical protein [Ignavibacteriales bacterium]
MQCGKCVIVCPHAVIRHKVYDEKLAGKAPRNVQTHRRRSSRNSPA